MTAEPRARAYTVRVTGGARHGDRRPVWTASVIREEDGSEVAHIGEDRSVRDLLRIVAYLLRTDWPH